VNFLDSYMEYCEGSEVPDMFYVWSGYAALSIFVGRNVFLRSGRMTYYPNIYVMLVGSAGSGKTQAMDVAKRFIEDVPNMAPRVSMSTETPEGWLRYMAGDPTTNPPTDSPIITPAAWPTGIIGPTHPMIIVANEFINFIAKDQAGWITTLNNIYDQDFFGYRTKNKGLDKIIGPSVVVLGALPTETSQELQKAHIIASGFARRTIFQYGERKFHEPHAIIHYDKKKEVIRQQLIEYATALSQVHGQFTWSTETQHWWKNWYDANSIAIPQSEAHLTDWLNSKPSHAIKIGMLNSLAESTDLELKIHHLERALDYFEILEKDLYKIFGGIGRNELAQVCIHIMDYISKQTQPLEFKVIDKATFRFCVPPYELEYCLRHLSAMGHIVEATYTTDASGQMTVKRLFATPEVMAAYAAAKSAQQAGQSSASSP
jgi:hypothetical protein